MRTKARFVPEMLACILTLASAANALAGDVKLVSNTMDTVCGVEVAWGPDAPNGAQVEFHVDVPKGWSITKPEKLCYRRASTPDNCESGMTQWKTQWRCAANSGADAKELSLE